jgi:hypothetical protein
VIEGLPPAADFGAGPSDMAKRLHKMKYILSGEAATAQYVTRFQHHIFVTFWPGTSISFAAPTTLTPLY